jgi:hypothetical protein
VGDNLVEFSILIGFSMRVSAFEMVVSVVEFVSILNVSE